MGQVFSMGAEASVPFPSTGMQIDMPYSPTRNPNAQDDFPPSADWKYDYKSSVSRSYKKPTLLPGLCPGRTACQCTVLTATARTTSLPPAPCT